MITLKSPGDIVEIGNAGKGNGNEKVFWATRSLSFRPHRYNCYYICNVHSFMRLWQRLFFAYVNWRNHWHCILLARTSHKFDSVECDTIDFQFDLLVLTFLFLVWVDTVSSAVSIPLFRRKTSKLLKNSYWLFIGYVIEYYCQEGNPLAENSECR